MFGAISLIADCRMRSSEFEFQIFSFIKGTKLRSLRLAIAATYSAIRAPCLREAPPLRGEGRRNPHPGAPCNKSAEKSQFRL